MQVDHIMNAKVTCRQWLLMVLLNFMKRMLYRHAVWTMATMCVTVLHMLKNTSLYS